MALYSNASDNVRPAPLSALLVQPPLKLLQGSRSSTCMMPRLVSEDADIIAPR